MRKLHVLIICMYSPSTVEQLSERDQLPTITRLILLPQFEQRAGGTSQVRGGTNDRGGSGYGGNIIICLGITTGQLRRGVVSNGGRWGQVRHTGLVQGLRRGGR